MMECQCHIPDHMAWAGPAAQLCHHSSVESAQEVQSNLIQILDEFAHSIPADDLLSKTVTQLAEDYKRNVVLNDYRFMNQNEHGVLMISFLRNLSIAVQTLMVTMIVNRERKSAR